MSGEADAGAEADLDHAHAARLDAGQPLDGPRQLVVQARPVVGQHLLAEALDDAGFVRAQRVEAVEDQQRAAA